VKIDTLAAGWYSRNDDSENMIDNILNISQVTLAVILMIAILLQARGTGLGAAFGGEGNIFRAKRGMEKRLFQATIVVAFLFFGVSLANVVL
jgi:preprotein translocase subunit SecG